MMRVLVMFDWMHNGGNIVVLVDDGFGEDWLNVYMGSWVLMLGDMEFLMMLLMVDMLVVGDVHLGEVDLGNVMVVLLFVGDGVDDSWLLENDLGMAVSMAHYIGGMDLAQTVVHDVAGVTTWDCSSDGQEGGDECLEMKER